MLSNPQLSLICKIFSLLVALAGASGARADLTLTGNVIFQKNGLRVPVPPELEPEKAKTFFKYRWKGANDPSDIRNASPVGVPNLDLFDEHSFFYKLRFNEEDALIRVRLEFKHKDFKGAIEKDFPRSGSDNLHLPVDRSDQSFLNALKLAEHILALSENEHEVLDAFDILLAEINNGAEFSYAGSRLLADLIEHYAQTAPQSELPIRFANFILEIDRNIPIEEFSDRKKFAIYRKMAESVTENYDLRQPLGGGSHVHDAARHMLKNALKIAYSFTHKDEDAPVNRSLIANVAFSQVVLDCNKIRVMENCFSAVERYVKWTNGQMPTKDIASFFSTVATALEIESGIPGSDPNERLRNQRLREDGYLVGFWVRYHCAITPLESSIDLAIADQNLDAAMKKTIRYLSAVNKVAQDVSKGESCHAT